MKNWTHSDTMGRFTVNVSVAYDSDAEKVKELLQQLTKAHPNVLTYPEPVVTLQKFGTYSLDFEIKGTVGDIFYGVLVASDLRFAILKALAKRGLSFRSLQSSVFSGNYCPCNRNQRNRDARNLKCMNSETLSSNYTYPRQIA